MRKLLLAGAIFGALLAISTPASADPGERTLTGVAIGAGWQMRRRRHAVGVAAA